MKEPKGTDGQKCPCCHKMAQVWMSKTLCYENPCVVTGNSQLAGSEEAPTVICTDRNNGTGKGQDAE